MIDFNISSFFGKFKNAELKEIEFRRIVVDSFKKNAGVEVRPGDIQFKNKIIRVQANPSIKNHIFIKKELILSEIKSQLPHFVILDIQ